MSAAGGSTATPLSSLELAAGMVLGRDSSTADLEPGSPYSSRAAFEEVVREALLRQPCFVSFSGGRDSSAVLALAVRVARREGLPDPIPVTLRFGGDVAAEETEWQSQVLSYLGVERHEIVDVAGDMLDFVGPTAREVILRHGPLFPDNTHCHLPMVKLASGGSLLTGFGGDELAMASIDRWAERSAFYRERNPRALTMIAIRRGPAVLRFGRELVRAKTISAAAPWLTLRARAAVRVREATLEASAGWGWDRTLREVLWPSRWIQVTKQHTQVMADTFGVKVLHPFADARVLRAIGAEGPQQGLGGRTELMHALFSDLLPRPVIARESKATFTNALWTSTAASFAAGSAVAGFDSGLIDTGRLRAAWANRGAYFSSHLLQQAYVAEFGRHVATGVAQ